MSEERRAAAFWPNFGSEWPPAPISEHEKFVAEDDGRYLDGPRRPLGMPLGRWVCTAFDHIEGMDYYTKGLDDP